MVDIFEYTDYRAFIFDLIKDEKKRNESFSRRAFSEKCRINSTGLMTDVIHGRRQLSNDNVFRICLAMNLGPGQSHYFQTMVNYASTPDKKLKANYKQLLTEIKNRRPSKKHKVVTEALQNWSSIAHKKKFFQSEDVNVNLKGLSDVRKATVEYAKTLEKINGRYAEKKNLKMYCVNVVGF